MTEAINEKFYNQDKLFNITFIISNAINPVFEVWATCEQYALDNIGDFLLDREYEGLYYTWDDLDELQDEHGEIEENFYQCDNGIFIDMDRINISEI